MNIQTINRDLMIARNLADLEYNKGNTEIGALILGIASKKALMDMEIAGIKSYPVICRGCNKKLTIGFEIEIYNQTGECLSCDHIRGEMLDEQLIEAKEMEEEYA